MFSYWEQESFLSNYDIIIIGSGIVGLNAAIELKLHDSKLNIAILERGILPTGASTKNAGFACFGSVSELVSDLSKHSAAEVWALVERRYNGLLKLSNRLGAANIEFYQYGNYEIFTNKELNIFNNCIEKLPEFNYILNDLIKVPQVFQVQDYKIQEFGLNKVEHLIWNSAEGQINTGKMMKTLLKMAYSLEINIFNGVEVATVQDNGNRVKIECKNFANFETKKVIVATNGFAKQLFANLEVTPARNQVLVTQKIANLNLKGCFHQDEGFIYFRNIDNRVLIGGGRNKNLNTEATDELELTDFIQNYLENILFTHILPNQKVKIEHRWAGILGLGTDKKPIIKKISDNIIVAVRMGGMGVAIGILVAEEAAKLAINY